jgi:predicted GTPase
MKAPRRWWWIIILSAFALPYLLLVAAGSFWLFEQGWLLWWSSLTAVTSLGAWFWFRSRSGGPLPPLRVETKSDPQWSPAARAAWQQVDALATRYENSNVAINEPADCWPILWDVLETVAKSFHPESTDPLLETPLPHLFKVMELVAHDLGQATNQNLPGAHILTLNDLRFVGRLAELNRRFYVVYKVLAFGINPVSAIVRHFRDLATDKLWGASSDAVRNWALGLAVRRAGFYAIQLYSGQLVLDSQAFEKFVSRGSLDDLRRSDEQGAAPGEPLRILILGQLKAGKSSLVNGLFGSVKAASDVIPLTVGVDAYLLQRDGIDQALILDTAGYADPRVKQSPFDVLQDQLKYCDLVLLVCSATSAARDSDRRLLDELRGHFAARPDRVMPPLLVVLTHIDQLRPWDEWTPPYDLRNPAGKKGQNIAEAVTAVAGDLAVDVDQVVPVCLLPERRYNVDEALVGAILEALPESRRARYLRCLEQYRGAEYWRQLRVQALNAGKFLLQTFGS